MAKSPAVLSLPLSFPPEVPQPASQAKAETPQSLWLALVFPKLALEVHDHQQGDIPAAVVKEYKGRSVVHTASRLAEMQGISVDMPVNAAYALCPGLKVYPVNEQSQIDRLQQLAIWAAQFTSKVNVQPPQALILEVRGSLRLFGGLPAIQSQIEQQLQEHWRHSFHSVVTPTPMASLLLAVSGQNDVVQDKQQLRSVLGRLTVNHLPIELKVQQQLRNTGVRLLKDLWRLPRDGLARRFGPGLINYLDRTLGLIPDPLEFIATPDAFEAFYEFPMEVHQTGLLLNIAEQLLQQLSAFLRQRDFCTNQCGFQLIHDRHKTTSVIIGVRRATRDYLHLTSLLEEHLNKLSLAAPVKSIRLIADDFIPFVPERKSLFIEQELGQPLTSMESDIDILLEQLQARIGHDAIRNFYGVADHRPEYAYRVSKTETTEDKHSYQHRPFWLLPEPQLLTQKHNRPWLQGPVTLIRGPERVESGWWTGHDVHRDYYTAVDANGSRLWIYQELKESRSWYLHGLFA